MNVKRLAALAAGMAVWGGLMLVAGWRLRDAAPPAAPVALAPAPLPTPSESASRLLDEAWSKVRESFVGDVPTDAERNYGAVRGAMATLNDRFSVFVEPQSRAVERDQQRGSFGGIGATLLVNTDGRIVLTPLRGAPAEKAGLKAGDLLLAVDGVPVPLNPNLDAILLRVRGDVGSVVVITIGRGADRFELRIVRAIIEVPSTTWRIETGSAGAKAGVIAISAFTARTSDEVKRAIGELRQDGATAFILDLRDNGGGLLNASIEVASQFIADGVILFEQRRGAAKTSFPSQGGGMAPTDPLVVVVNANTASASEIVAGAIQDRGRGKLVGVRTYGKGSAQYIYDLSDGSSVHVTFAKWLTPAGRSIDGVGLEPDVEMKAADGDAQRGEDSQLAAALKILFP